MKIKQITSDGITFDNGMEISHNHEQDCCENVYADWESLKTEAGVMEHNFTEDLKIEGVPESGFRLDGFFVACYNSQNGYYSSDLELVIKYPDKRTKKHIDISDWVLDQID